FSFFHILFHLSVAVLSKFPEHNKLCNILIVVELFLTINRGSESTQNKLTIKEFWKGYKNELQGESNTGHTWYSFYLAFPLIIGLFIILIVIFVIWRCLFKKKMRRQSVYIGPLPPPLSIVHSPQEEMYEVSGLSPGDLSYTDGCSDSISTRLSNCDPPPSYEEATGEITMRRNIVNCNSAGAIALSPIVTSTK
uniref:Uncharacterized protein n=1 Tax=Melopsittacus undulatus TaxID=13146 RepID=A0A8V5H4Y7_MELUD